MRNYFRHGLSFSQQSKVLFEKNLYEENRMSFESAARKHPGFFISSETLQFYYSGFTYK